MKFDPASTGAAFAGARHPSCVGARRAVPLEDIGDMRARRAVPLQGLDVNHADAFRGRGADPDPKTDSEINKTFQCIATDKGVAFVGARRAVPTEDIGDMRARRAVPLQDCLRFEHLQHDLHLGFVDIPALMQACSPGRNTFPSLIRPGLNPIENHLHLPFLSSRELEQVNSFKALKRQVEWISGRYAVKRLVCEIAGVAVDMREIEAAQASEGSPYLPAWPDYSLSISHSGGLAVAGICLSPHKIIGLDIEHIASVNVSAILKAGFTEKEVLEIGEPTPRELLRRWTVKEAYLKYLRKGFNESLKHVEYRGGHIFYNQTPQMGVRIESRDIDEEFVFALVYGEVAEQVKMNSW